MNTWDPPLKIPYATNIEINRESDEGASFFCQRTYCVLISMDHQEHALQTEAGLFNKSTVRELANKSFLPWQRSDQTKPDHYPDLSIDIRQAFYIDGIMLMFLRLGALRALRVRESSRILQLMGSWTHPLSTAVFMTYSEANMR